MQSISVVLKRVPVVWPTSGIGTDKAKVQGLPANFVASCLCSHFKQFNVFHGPYSTSARGHMPRAISKAPARSNAPSRVTIWNGRQPGAVIVQQRFSPATALAVLNMRIVRAQLRYVFLHLCHRLSCWCQFLLAAVDATLTTGESRMKLMGALHNRRLPIL